MCTMDVTTKEVPAVSNNDDLIDVAEKAKALTNIVKVLEMEKDTLETKVKELQEECDCLDNTIQVNDMIHESFKERVRDKYCYDTNDKDSDYEPDHDIRAKNKRSRSIDGNVMFVILLEQQYQV